MSAFGITRAIARKELLLFFSAPVGYLFLLTFLAFTLFVFFWGEAFFARNIADVRPMFEWLPILLIFLSAALTMRMWSEERRVGTLEFVLTVPATPWQFVVGKFLACWLLLVVALLMTLPLAITVSIISNLDWGPVIAGYIAAVLLGGAYISIGLYLSASTDNQVVSLILATFFCGLFYMVGSPFLAGLFDNQIGDLLRSLGTGSRFESITRGLLDVRDLCYYVSIAGVFLVLNVYALKSHGWAGGGASVAAQRETKWVTALLVTNLIAVNLWLGGINAVRWDLTEGKQYSISSATKAYLAQLREPLLIRGYFSTKTHPLLAPLIPQLTDLLKEYGIVSEGKTRVEIVDPAQAPELEDEANKKYGIRPVPFQVSDRYQSSVVNSYFDVLLQYGDAYEVLGFSDLIEVKAKGSGNVDVRLRNPEFDITKSIKKVLQSYQSGGVVFDSLTKPVEFRGYISARGKLPKALRTVKADLDRTLNELTREADGKFTSSIVDPQADGGTVAAQIKAEHGFTPMASSLLDNNRFYFYMVLTDGETLIQVPLPEVRDEAGLKRTLEEGLKRFSTGLLNAVAVRTPPAANPYLQQQQQAPANTYNTLLGLLDNNFEIENLERIEASGLRAATSVLMVLDPKILDENELFAVDQFLMRGGTVLIALGGFEVVLSQQGFVATAKQSGLEDWLEHHGVTIAESFVLDPKNTRFPVPVQRRVGPISFREIKMLNYPYFADLRNDSLNQEVAPIAALSQVTMAWASPVEVAEDTNSERQLTTLLRSSPNAWRSSSTEITPKAEASVFVPEGELDANPLAIMLEGRFDSFFDEPPPPREDEETAEPGEEEEPAEPGLTLSSVIERSPESSRLIVIGSGSFVADQVLGVLSSIGGTQYTNSAQMIVNLVDWAVEDVALLTISSRGHFNRTLPPMPESDQKFWEYMNYGIAVLLVLLVLLFNLYQRMSRQRRQLVWLHEGGRR